MDWDIFCKVIDNHGDIGVCWRLAADLAARGESVRLWVDDPAALGWMAPQGQPGVQVMPWTAAPTGWAPGDVVIEAFGCEIDDSSMAAIAQQHTRRAVAWINLEYLSAERFVQRTHGLPSPVLTGPGAGLTKHFFYPGFTPGTGGLIREPDLLTRQARFDAAAWLRAMGLDGEGPNAQRISLFCYEPPAVQNLIDQWAQASQRTELLVTAGRAAQAVRAVLGEQTRRGALQVHYLPLLRQADFDHLLWSCDLNFVRGEDSLVRALWAGKPLAWQIYPQHDDAHHAKLQAFLDWLQPPQSQRDFHLGWNAMAQGVKLPDVATWQAAALQARERLLAQDDLTTQLQAFATRVLTNSASAKG